MVKSSKIKMQEYRKRNPCAERQRIVARQKEKQAVINAYKLGKGCSKCGYKEAACALDFHHKEPSKKSKSIINGLLNISIYPILFVSSLCSLMRNRVSLVIFVFFVSWSLCG